MAQSKIIVDSNSYFRLAYSIHPFLFTEFGSKCYCLYVLPELQDEYDRNPRLKSKFPWVDSEEYVKNRTKKIALSKKNKNEISIVRDMIWNYVVRELPGPSRIDVEILSFAYVLGIPVVTDDSDMIDLANIFKIETIKTLGLLKLMLDCGHIDMNKVRQITSYWSYISDFPKNYASDYKKLFSESPPP